MYAWLIWLGLVPMPSQINQAFVNMVMNLRLPYMAGNLLRTFVTDMLLLGVVDQEKSLHF